MITILDNQGSRNGRHAVFERSARTQTSIVLTTILLELLSPLILRFNVIFVIFAIIFNVIIVIIFNINIKCLNHNSSGAADVYPPDIEMS